MCRHLNETVGFTEAHSAEWVWVREGIQPHGEGVPGATPEKLEKYGHIYAIFKINFIVISYLVELFIFEWFLQIRTHTCSFLSGFYRSEHIPDLNCRA